MRLFALYLPQFHEVEENNQWWGKGFTEWTHVNGAKPLFKGHQQPIAPLDNNYYNLMDKATVQWQTDLMKQYGIDGFVYYHYYFCGKKLLNKPAENLLNWTDIDQPFFFCWANHTWYKATKNEKKVLLEQAYGTEDDWEAHFDYLLPFFRDNRYEKKDNKPVFMIFADFPEKHDMMRYFDRRCKKAGFDGIYVIETFTNSYRPENFTQFQNNLCEQAQQTYIREPAVSTLLLKRKKNHTLAGVWDRLCQELVAHNLIHWVQRYNGDDLFSIMRTQSPRGKNLCHGMFFSWDNTPRHGIRGYIITAPSKESFLQYADSVKDDEYVFINAWNEWAEGMILEPTTHNGFKFLEWIHQWSLKNR